MACKRKQKYRLVKRTVDQHGRTLRIYHAAMRGEAAHQGNRECARRVRQVARAAEAR